MGQFTIPDERDAAAKLDIEVEAKQLLYGRAVYGDGSPVYELKYRSLLIFPVSVNRSPGVMNTPSPMSANCSLSQERGTVNWSLCSGR